MKIRLDFVTNSSSSSFVVMWDRRLDEEFFMQKLGIMDDSPLRPLYSDIFSTLMGKLTESKIHPGMSDLKIKKYIRSVIYGGEMKVNQILKAYREGKKNIADFELWCSSDEPEEHYIFRMLEDGNLNEYLDILLNEM